MESSELAKESRRKLIAAQSWRRLSARMHKQNKRYPEDVAELCERACTIVLRISGVPFNTSASGHGLVSGYVP